ncbi:MAG: ZIP family metal transporter [Candidatus Micrarchaeia archaeon]
MSTLFWILASTFLVSLLSLIGSLFLAIKEAVVRKILIILVSLSAGALIGGAFLHLIPEAINSLETSTAFEYTLIGFISFFLIEKVLHWRHCHDKRCTVHTFAYINLFGDVVHNFIDGAVIAASFMASIPLGIATTLAIALHEIPQELGDFGVLLYGGFKKTKALFLNFICALVAILGGISSYFLSGYIEGSIVFLLPFAAGGFIYISASDLIPEIRKETNIKKSFTTLAIFIIGILLMAGMKIITHE